MPYFTVLVIQNTSMDCVAIREAKSPKRFFKHHALTPLPLRHGQCQEHRFHRTEQGQAGIRTVCILDALLASYLPSTRHVKNTPSFPHNTGKEATRRLSMCCTAHNAILASRDLDGRHGNARYSYRGRHCSSRTKNRRVLRRCGSRSDRAGVSVARAHVHRAARTRPPIPALRAPDVSENIKWRREKDGQYQRH